jgi:hypothetical protein
MDRNWNFPVRAVGNKTLSVFDHTDPSVVSQEAREVRSMGWNMQAHSGRRPELIGIVLPAAKIGVLNDVSLKSDRAGKTWHACYRTRSCGHLKIA